MAIVWARKRPGERRQTGAYQESYEYEEVWLVRTDSPTEKLKDITNATGVGWMDPYPDDTSCKAYRFNTVPVGDSGLLYKVTVYYRMPPADTTENGGEGSEPTAFGIMKQPIWSGGSSVVAVPVFEHYESGNGQRRTITNSANEPIEGLEAEQAEFRLTLRSYYLNHAAWMADARTYTNAVNSDTWNGGMAGTWKCQGCSAQLQVENSGGVTVIFWEVTWEFAYRDDTWNLKPWDVGFSQLVDNSGTPSGTGTKRAAILGQDKKPTKIPVALAGGVALPAGSPPQVINNGNGVRVYRQFPFLSKFGQVYTPTIPST